MTGSKSSQTTRNVVIACLALWSVISLIIIVVWATSPDLKGAHQCRSELEEQRREYEKARVTWENTQKVLEEQVNQGRENQSTLQNQIQLLNQHLTELNATLGECQQENVILRENITALENEIEAHIRTEANLTSEIALQKEQIECLQLNLTQTQHSLEACAARQSAAESLMTAAKKDTEACQSSKQFLQKQIQKCKSTQHDPPENSAPVSALGSALFLVIILSLNLFLTLLVC
ncbi:uncharacterized protein LOC115821280 [Chanos chanos]|uniref:Uncharacterized protein LOC115821280 n=1 Tax=Chanos chanos TaxID=29144 RepID=A0A6J2WAI9_CHACN|nr:uncharacterized protein LOC115821280 [Chanos chanos]